MANGVTTEWEDIHVKLGNYAPREKETPQHELNKIAQETFEKVEDKKVDSDFEDDFSDDDFFEKYKQSRMNEVKETLKKPHFGSVLEIGKDQYIAEVNQAPAESFVVIHMYQDYLEPCKLINQWIDILAKKHPLVKFIKIVATKCIENFPDQNCPCLLIYKAGKAVSNLQCIDQVLKKLDIDCFTQMLQSQSVLPVDDEEKEIIQMYKQTLLNPNFKQNMTEADDKIDDREYTSEIINSKKRYFKY